MLNFGGFLSSNFWTNYRCQSSASIEDLLSSKDCSVDKLLDDDDCLQEFKNYNDKLIKYFDHDKLKVLIDYITVMPEKDEQNRGHKYPFIAGEIFNCEINQILDKFFEAPVKVKPAAIVAPEASADATEATEATEDSENKDETAEKPEEDKPAEEGAAKDLETEAEKTEENPNEEKTEPEEAKEEVKEEPKKEEVKVPEEQNTQEPESEEHQDSPKPVVEAETPAETKPEAKAEPEEEEATEKPAAEKTTTDEMATTATTLQTEDAPEEEEDDEEEGNKYLLLERLFKFIEQAGDEDLNPVLSGYFCKLVSLLISRKQKQLFPFIFAKESTVIEDLLKHVYQKSISEILNKLLTLVDTDHEPEIVAMIQEKQQMAVSYLIDSLGPEKSEEHNLNASTIIQDMFEIKEFYNIICQKENLQKIVDFALAGMKESTKDSKCSSLTVLNQIIMNHIERQKKKEQKADADKDNNDEDDDIVQQNSDDEAAEDEASNPNSVAAQTQVLVEVLLRKIEKIETILQNDHEGPMIRSSVTDEEFVPLGQQRLYTIELVLRMVQLKKVELYDALGESKIFANIMALVKQYPWNNFMQLKVIAISDEILDNCEVETFKKEFLTGSGIAKSLVDMAAVAQYDMNTGRTIRNGYMALVVSISNKLVKKFKGTGTQGTEDSIVVEYLDNVGEEWRAFVDDELAASNTNNNKTLGGSTKIDDGEGENSGGDDPNYDDQMEKIMQRFTNFNQILSQGSNDTEENDDSDENEETPDNAVNDSDDTDTDDNKSNMKIEKVVIPEAEPLNKEFTDNTFWSVDKTAEAEFDYDSLLAELEA